MFQATIAFPESTPQTESFETAIQAIWWIERKASRQGTVQAAIDGHTVSVINGRVKGIQ